MVSERKLTRHAKKHALKLADKVWGKPVTRSIAAALSELIDHPPERDYSGYPVWHALLVEPNREEKSAEWLERVHVHVYLPMFSKVVARRGQKSGRRQSAVVGGMLFVPQEIVDIKRREEVFDYAHVYGFLSCTGGAPARLDKTFIEEMRSIEAKLNMPPPEKPIITLKLGDPVRFKNELYAEYWGTGTVVDVANAHRIGVRVNGLFRRATKAYFPASEIEAM